MRPKGRGRRDERGRKGRGRRRDGKGSTISEKTTPPPIIRRLVTGLRICCVMLEEFNITLNTIAKPQNMLS